MASWHRLEAWLDEVRFAAARWLATRRVALAAIFRPDCTFCRRTLRRLPLGSFDIPIALTGFRQFQCPHCQEVMVRWRGWKHLKRDLAGHPANDELESSKLHELSRMNKVREADRPFHVAARAVEHHLPPPAGPLAKARESDELGQLTNHQLERHHPAHKHFRPPRRPEDADVELNELVEHWADLPKSVRASIATIVRLALKERQED